MSRKPTTRKEAELACKIIELVEEALKETADLNMCIVQRYCTGMLAEDHPRQNEHYRMDPTSFEREIGRQF